MDQQLLSNILLAVVTLVIGLLGYALRELIALGIAWLKTKISAERYEELLVQAGTVVSFLQQSPAWEETSKAELKSFALAKLQQWAIEHGYEFDWSAIDQAIEREVQIMKVELPYILEE